MEDFRRNHVPAFGSWDCSDDLPFTQCFESARQAGLLRYKPPSPVSPPPPLPRRQAPKAVDEDLYKISPELLRAKPKGKRVLGFFSSCMLPTCAL
ncbi:hypothetical protein F0562_021690 [Nyssa sinensis]|uniref:RIN4 pathogenic type III effector avirulence factor Avr cleavage site domain-containing protein n=1 Tax=Nyssa sinensis TaxID=561372 RepID=A0A5J5BLC8_9ASTE|nr:hypothetical protein F0562_021690 [Nyssa sinensis]